MIDIGIFEDRDTNEIIDLVLHFQNDGSRPKVTVNDQKDLLNIYEEYIKTGGNFWVAKDNDKVVGTIGLMICPNNIALLKKFFVYEVYQGKPHHLGQQLYQYLIQYAQKNGIKTLILDTPKNTARAHKFYEKAGWKIISEDKLPFTYNHPYQDSDFFILEL